MEAPAATSSDLAAHASEMLPEPRFGKELSSSVSSSGDAKQESDIASAQIPLARIHIKNLQRRNSDNVCRVGGAGEREADTKM